MGSYIFPVTTTSKNAQLFINQGLMLAYGFNHAEAARSFGEAARLDPACAMAYWGMAWVGGPNINMEMSPDAEPQAYKLVQRAMALKKGVSEREQAYIEALSRRYSGDAHADRGALDRAYAEAMRALHNRYPDDLDAATLRSCACWNPCWPGNRTTPEPFIFTFTRLKSDDPNWPNPPLKGF
ncbi:MAG: hypothetical protein MUC33_08305 [Desulfobacterales bacterium]|nr:hypothetical protein [Desulfobacterales bacterium]